MPPDLPNHDSFVALSGRDANGDQLAFRITSLPSRGLLYQYDAGGRGSLIASPNTPVIDSLARIIFAPAPNESGSPYSSFGVVANDGDADSMPATITLNLILPPAPQMIAGKSVVRTDGIFDLNFSGQSNASYRVWASTNLLDWEVLGIATTTSNGWFNFLDSTTSSPQRFYRAGAP